MHTQGQVFSRDITVKNLEECVDELEAASEEFPN